MSFILVTLLIIAMWVGLLLFYGWFSAEHRQIKEQITRLEQRLAKRSKK